MVSGLYTSSHEVKGRMQNFDHIVWRKAGVEEEPRLLDEVTDVGFLQVQCILRISDAQGYDDRPRVRLGALHTSAGPRT